MHNIRIRNNYSVHFVRIKSPRVSLIQLAIIILILLINMKANSVINLCLNNAFLSFKRHSSMDKTG